MPVKINNKASKADKNRATVIVECDTIPPLNVAQVQEMASKYASTVLGLSTPGLSNSAGPYPVNKEGEATEDVATGKEEIGCYRREFTFLGR
jgi:hypothetical protein